VRINLALSRTVPCYLYRTHLYIVFDGATNAKECRRACRVALTSHAKRMRDRVEAGGGAVGARAGRLVLGVEDDVLGRLAAARRARGVRGTEERHHHTRHLWLG